MNKINILHIAEIDDDLSKGTSYIIPYYVLFQQHLTNNNVMFLNCNDKKISILFNNKKTYYKKDNVKMSVVKRAKPDIVVFHEIYKPYFIKIYLYLRKNNIPYIIIPHGGLTRTAQNVKKIKKIIGNKLLFSNFINNASMIQYLSKKEQVETKFPKLKNFVLGNGYKNILDENLYLKKHKHNNKIFTFIYVGRYDYYVKGIDQLLEAFKLVHENNLNNVKLKLFGKGNEDTCSTIKHYIVSNKLENVIEFNGPIFDEEKVNQIISSDVFIQVSRTEGQPLGVVEALCLGMPVLLSKGTGYREIVDQNKIGICTETDANEIFDAIKTIVNNSSCLNEYSNNAYLYSKQNYSWNKITKIAMLKYIEVINSKKGE